MNAKNQIKTSYNPEPVFKPRPAAKVKRGFWNFVFKTSINALFNQMIKKAIR